MVGLVIVSHSAKLAEGVAELARGMAGSDAPLAVAGGLADSDETVLGTDAMLILQAIEQVYSDDGVVVLMDIGSAILSAEMARDLLPDEQRENIVLCDAPLVEGALAAAVQAKLGSPLSVVVAEARSALTGKSSHLGQPTSTPELAPPGRASDSGTTAQAGHDQLEARVSVQNRLGLHARPVARLVQLAHRYQADIQIQNLTSGRGPVNAKSINAVMTLGIRQGQAMGVRVTGSDAAEALAAIRALADDNFGDEDGPAPETPPPVSVTPIPTPTQVGTVRGLAASPGIAIGPARRLDHEVFEIPQYTATDPQQEWAALQNAMEKTRVAIQASHDAVARRADTYTAGIFEAHLLFLSDETLLTPVRQAIFEDHLNAAAAWQRVTDAIAAEYRALDDNYLQARAADVTDVARQTLRHLLQPSQHKRTFEPGILIADDLGPADVAGLDPRQALGLCTSRGSATSHAAILAKTLGIPAVVGLGEGLLAVTEGTSMIVDGEAGQVWLNPEADLVADYTQRLALLQTAQAEAAASATAPAITRDGRRIEVAANIGSLADARAAVAAGAEGVGLFRTEFLFQDRDTAPTEEEQYQAYVTVAEVLQSRPLIIRTLDVGGDKPLRYLPMTGEANPFLGWRAIRLCLDQPDLFKTQLRAIVRVAALYPIKIMFPMIATLTEWRAARALLAEATAEVEQRHGLVPLPFELGIMVEIPAAAVQADHFADEVDFFSIGTNDLTQYTLAAERGNAQVAHLADAFQPAVVSLIRQVIDAAHAHGKWVGVCGEFASDPLAIPLLVGLGIDELSMNAPAIARAKQIIRGLNTDEAKKVSQAALRAETTEAVRQVLSQAIEEH